MIAELPDHALAAERYHTMNIAAAKLALAAGVKPAEVRRISRLKRITIKRSANSVRHQVVELTKMAVLTGEHVPHELTDQSATTARILSHADEHDLGRGYLEICAQAVRNERLHIYYHHTTEFQNEHNTISDEYFRCTAKFKQYENDYELVGNRLDAIADKLPVLSWPARRALADELDNLVRRRDKLRALLSNTYRQIVAISDKYRRHQARRVYYHSHRVPEYRDASLVFIPPSTLRRMNVCPFDEMGAGATFRDTALRLMREWNDFCEQFAVDRRAMLKSHELDEQSDHYLRIAIRSADCKRA